MAFYKTSTSQERMFLMKKFTVVLAALTGLSIALTQPLKANAFDVDLGDHGRFQVFEPSYNHSYAVYYRRPYDRNWRYKGTYGSKYEAEGVKHYLRHKGYDAFVERVG
jgi:hypothetical protein